MLKVTAALKAELYPFYAPHAAANHARRLAKRLEGGAGGAGAVGAAAAAREGEGSGVPAVVVSVHGAPVSVPPSAFLRDRADFKAAGAKLRQRIKDKLCPRDPLTGQRTAPRRYSRTSTGGYIRKYVAAYMASRAAAKAGGAGAAGSAPAAAEAEAGLGAGAGTAAGEGAEAGEGDAAGMEAPRAEEEGGAAAGAEAQAPGSDSESDGGEDEGSDGASDAEAEESGEGKGATTAAAGADDVLADIFEPETASRAEAGNGAAAEGPAS
jgi:hypothetical protein